MYNVYLHVNIIIFIHVIWTFRLYNKLTPKFIIWTLILYNKFIIWTLILYNKLKCNIL